MLGLRFGLLSAVFYFLAMSYAFAAEIKTLSLQPLDGRSLWGGACTHLLEGEIVEGDAVRFQQALDALPGQEHDEKNFLLCMNSPGGNLAEGLALGQLIRDHWFGTYVPEGGQCLSACAIAFMHGRVAYWEYWENHRMIHPKAVLGFHAPKLDIPLMGGQVPVQLVDAAYESAISIIAQLADNAASPSNKSNIAVIPLTLLAEMLKTPPEDFLLVDTMGEAFVWDIEIFPNGLVPPEGFDLKVGYYQLCFNADFETKPQGNAGNPTAAKKNPPKGYGRVVDSDYVQFVESLAFPIPAMPEGHTYIAVPGLETIGCSYLYTPEFDGFEVRQYVDGNFISEVWLPAVYMFAPDIKITDIWPK